jgi:phosphoglycolate phosphatase
VRTAPRLVLFDIDGTLLSAGRASREALSHAFASAAGIEMPFDGYDFSGKTDPQIVGELLEGRIEPRRIDHLRPRILEAYLECLDHRVSEAEIVLKPGVARLLAHLAPSHEITMGLLTGNLERGARAKLRPPDLNRYFSFGAFGSDHADRYRLPEIAVSRAREQTGRRFSGKEIIVIGDSVHDVGCGRSLDVRSIAVASGLTPARRLQEELPDFLFDDLSDTDAVVRAIAA